ncbi:MAG: hypothetical protein Q9210_000368 [Variospora velana]
MPSPGRPLGLSDPLIAVPSTLERQDAPAEALVGPSDNVEAYAPYNHTTDANASFTSSKYQVDNPTADSRSRIELDNVMYGMQNLNVSGGTEREESETQSRLQSRNPHDRGASDNDIGQPIYLDPTPTTPRLSTSSSRAPSPVRCIHECHPVAESKNFRSTNEDNTTSEIQSILEQFDGGGRGSNKEISYPRLEFANSLPVQHPPRKSSLDPVKCRVSTTADGDAADKDPVSDPKQPPHLHTEGKSQTSGRAASVGSFSTPQSTRFTDQVNDTASPQSSISGSRPQPPEPEPEPEVPFDFHRFLEQLRHRTADPVAKFLRSFLLEFGKKQWMVHEQVKIISDFLTFITGRMAQCEVWRGVSDAEFDNAKEGMEKLVMNRLYLQTFSPAIPPPAPLPGAKGKKKNAEKLLGPGRKGQHQEDIERDEILGQKVRIYRWVQEEHLDIPPLDDNGRRFMSFAQQQLLKVNMYRAPRDKIVCVLNCCKVIFGFLSTSKSADTSADSFVPLLIYVVLRANPEHLVSNVQYILRFRRQEKLGGEAGYYLSSLMGAIQFIENLDRTSLTISDEEFERKVEASVSEIAERHEEIEEALPAPVPPPPPPHPTHLSEKSGLSEPQMIPRNSMEAEYNTPSRPLSSRGSLDRRTCTDSQEDSHAVSGLLRTIQRPLSSIGRMFSEDTSSGQFPSSQGAQQAPQPEAPRRLSPAVFQPPRRSVEETHTNQPPLHDHQQQIRAEDAAARQASAEAAEAHRIQRVEHKDVVDILTGMFPDLDRDIIDDVVREKQGRRRLQTMFLPKRKDSRSGLQHSIELKHLNRMRSYGTVPSEDLEAHTLPSQQRITPREREQARKMRNVKGFGALMMTMCLILFLWCSLSEDRETPAVEPPSVSPPPLSGDTSLYLWLVEHDSDAHDPNFATLKTLFAVDMYATNTTDAHVNGPNVETARTGPLAAVLVPGFYMLPGRAPGPLSNIVPGGPAHNANTNVTDVLRSALGPPRGRSASVKRGEPPTHDAAGSSIQSLQAMPPAAIVTTKTEIVAKASKKSMKSVYAALGMVVSLFLLTGTGHWMKRKRALAAKRAAQSQGQSNEPYQFNNHSIPEPEDIRGTQTNHDLKSRVRAFFSVNLWNKALSLPLTRDNDAVSDLDDAERGDNGRELQKKRGTRLGDSVDLGVPIMPPAVGAIQSARPASNAASTEGILRVKTENVRPAIVEGLTTARHQGPRGAATRRSHRSSSMQTENA